MWVLFGTPVLSVSEMLPPRPDTPESPVEPVYPFQMICSNFFAVTGMEFLVVVDRYLNYPIVYREVDWWYDQRFMYWKLQKSLKRKDSQDPNWKHRKPFETFDSFGKRFWSDWQFLIDLKYNWELHSIMTFVDSIGLRLKGSGTQFPNQNIGTVPKHNPPSPNRSSYFWR